MNADGLKALRAIDVSALKRAICSMPDTTAYENEQIRKAWKAYDGLRDAVALLTPDLPAPGGSIATMMTSAVEKAVASLGQPVVQTHETHMLAAQAMTAADRAFLSAGFVQAGVGRGEGPASGPVADSQHGDYEHPDGRTARVDLYPAAARWETAIEVLDLGALLDTEVRCVDGGWRSMRDILNVEPQHWPPPRRWEK